MIKKGASPFFAKEVETVLSKRLSVLLDHVRREVIADIGCDHAWLAVEAVKSGKAGKAYACDVAAGPIQNAEKNIRNEGVSGRVAALLMDGIAGLPADTEQIFIAGLGAETIVDILEKGSRFIPDRVLLTLSPHSKSADLRKWLSENGWAIEQEQTVKDGSHFYPVMDVSRGDQRLSQVQILYGKNVRQDADREEYIGVEKQRLESLLARVPANLQAEIRAKLQMLSS